MSPLRCEQHLRAFSLFTQSLLSQIAFITNRFYHKIAFITESLLSQNRFYHKIAFITTLTGL
jgi:hypothetical protein